MPNPLDAYASDYVGESQLPRPRSIFTPMAFDESTSIADRARLARRNLQSNLQFAAAESQMRDFVVKGQQQELQSAQIQRQLDLEAAQPALQQEVDAIDPTDDGAFEKLSELDASILDRNLRRRVTNARMQAQEFQRKRTRLWAGMRGMSLPEGDMQNVIDRVSAQYREGDLDAFDSALAGMPTHNQLESVAGTARREAAAEAKDYAKELDALGDLGFDASSTEDSVLDKLPKDLQQNKAFMADFLANPVVAAASDTHKDKKDVALLGKALVDLRRVKKAADARHKAQAAALMGLNSSGNSGKSVVDTPKRGTGAKVGGGVERFLSD